MIFFNTKDHVSVHRPGVLNENVTAGYGGWDGGGTAVPSVSTPSQCTEYNMIAGLKTSPSFSQLFIQCV